MFQVLELKAAQKKFWSLNKQIVREERDWVHMYRTIKTVNK